MGDGGEATAAGGAPQRRVAVVGAGYVGATTGAVFAKHGHRVTLVDLDAERVDLLRKGELPFYEPGVPEMLRDGVAKGRVEATTDLAAAVAEADLVFLCVGTPSRDDGGIDLSHVEAAARDVGRALALRARSGREAKPRSKALAKRAESADAATLERPVVVVKSTVVPGTTEGVVVPALAEASGLEPGAGFGVAVNPEFLREGNAAEDALRPDRIVVGATDDAAADAVWGLYRRVDAPKLTVDPTTAEFIKYAANAFLALKVDFANEMANLAEALGVDVYDVMEGVGFDHRINHHFLRAGAGFGGSCFPKDVRALAHVAREAGAPSGLLDAVLAQNDAQPLRVVDILEDAAGSLEGKRVALLGLAFKPGTDDVRETRALPIYRALVDRGADVVVHDPQAVENFRALAGGDVQAADAVEDALQGAHAAVVQTEWPQYTGLAPRDFLDRMATPLVVDGRRAFEAGRMWAAGVDYRAIGLGTGRAPPTPGQ